MSPSSLDLSGNTGLSISQTRKRDLVCGELSEPFSRMVDGLSAKHADSIDWWASEVPSRNTYTSRLFRDCCDALFATRMVDENPSIDEIVVGSWGLHRTLSRHFEKYKKNVRVTWRGSYIYELQALAIQIPRWFKLALVIFFRWLCAWRTRPQQFPEVPSNCTLVDTFVLEGSFVEGVFRDRYFPGLLQPLSDRERQDLVYLPTYSFDLKHTAAQMQHMRASKPRFLIPEDHLSASDFIWAWLHPVRLAALYPERGYLNGIDVTPIVRETWLRFIVSSTSVYTLLKFSLTERLRERKVTIRLRLNWFENYISDKVTNAGFRRAFPDTPIIGYQGFHVPPHFLCIYPTRQEQASRVLPTTLAVCGRLFPDSRRRFCPDLPVVVAPALRFAHLWQETRFHPDPEKTTILVALPMPAVDACALLAAVAALQPRDLPANVQMWIKTHPAGASLEVLARQAGIELPTYVVEKGGDFLTVIEQTNVFIGCVGSACLEALAKGVPTIIFGNPCKLTENPIPPEIPQEFWRLNYSSEEMIDTLRYFTSLDATARDGLKLSARQICETCFEKPTLENTRALLGLSKRQ